MSALKRALFLGVTVCAGLVLAAPVSAQPCAPAWEVDIGSPGLDGPVFAFAFYDSGTGPRLYVAGQFATAGGLSVANIARWNGSTWADLDTGANSSVYALATWAGGAGPAAGLYVGGSFGLPASRVARWNGSSWSALGTGTNSAVNALVFFNNKLIAGGIFGTAGGNTAVRIAAWDGSAWSALVGPSNGCNSTVYTLAATDDSSAVGPALYVGGSFSTAGGVAASKIAKWNGTTWSALGTGSTNNNVFALAIWDDGTGPALYAGGRFTTIMGTAAEYIAKWNGTSWSPVGTGLNERVLALAAFDDGNGPALYAGGLFTTAGGAPANNIAKWDGQNWSALAGGVNSDVDALLGASDAAWPGPNLYVGGGFTQADGIAAVRAARWEGCGPPVPGDCTGDRIVNLADHASFAACLTGPIPGSVPAECTCANLDGDADVDLNDWALFQHLFEVAP